MTYKGHFSEIFSSPFNCRYVTDSAPQVFFAVLCTSVHILLRVRRYLGPKTCSQLNCLRRCWIKHFFIGFFSRVNIDSRRNTSGTGLWTRFNSVHLRTSSGSSVNPNLLQYVENDWQVIWHGSRTSEMVTHDSRVFWWLTYRIRHYFPRQNNDWCIVVWNYKRICAVQFTKLHVLYKMEFVAQSTYNDL